MKSKKKNKRDIAIIGLACRFPEANNIQEFWDNLVNGVDSIRPVPDERWDVQEYTGQEISEPLKTVLGKGGFLKDIDLFDARHFKIKEERARLMDPQQRLALEVTAEAINHAGYVQKDLSGTKTGVFFSAGQGDYGRSKNFLSKDKRYLLDRSILIDERNGVLGNLPNMIASNISYYFNFQGPNMVVDTMCSSSATALHLACQSLLCKDSKCAIVGGVQLYHSPYTFIQASKTGVLSPNGITSPFSKEAKGYALSEGVGVLVLKRLSDAIEDGNTIYAVIKASTINSDGKTMSSATPSVNAEKNVIMQTLKRAKIRAELVSYLEANGTAMELGDPLEVKACTAAFEMDTQQKQYCALGSVESNIGHALHAASMARIIKTTLALYNKKIPPTIHCEEENPKISFSETPFYLNHKCQEWKPIEGRRIAGINSFGIGGSNCHIILEEFRPQEYPEYKQMRKPLPDIKFNRKRYWLDDEVDCQKECEEESRIKEILDTIYEVLGFNRDEVLPETRFESLGLDSLKILGATQKLEETFGNLPKTLFFEYHSMKELAEYFYTSTKANIPMVEKRSEKTEAEKSLDIAIVGLSGRYPQAKNIQEFWNNLKIGKDCIVEIPKDRPGFENYRAKVEQSDEAVSKWGGFLDDMDSFDPLFFQISPKEAALMDPQERIFLETAWECLEDAGYGKNALWGKSVGVFVGVMYDHYPIFGACETEKQNETAMGKTTSSIPNRVSYCFNLTGPSVAVNTMCSSSLTAFHLASESIKRGECESAIVGGVNLSLHEAKYYSLHQGKFLSSDGRCRSFGDGGDGYVPGEGVGAVLLKPLYKAEEDGDIIYGVLKGTGINHGGRTNGFTVPSPVMQGKLASDVMKMAGALPETVSYIEAHGTGTSLGDPIEVEGLTKAFSIQDLKKQSCAIGSVKSNIGHLEAAAGIASLTKVLLQMKYKKLVPSIHSKQLNPYIDFEHTPFYVQQELNEWQTSSKVPRRALINAFGAGGSNACMLIEEYERRNHIEVIEEETELFLISARSEQSLLTYAKNIYEYLKSESGSQLSLSETAYTLAECRENFLYRLAILAHSMEEVKECLQLWIETSVDRPGRIYSGVAEEGRNDNSSAVIWRKDEVQNIAKAWVNGSQIIWNNWFHQRKVHKVCIPVCPFEDRVCWYQTDKNVRANEVISSPIHSSQISKSSGLEGKGFFTDKVKLEVIENSIALVTMCDQDNQNMFSDEIVGGLKYQFREIKKMEQIKVIVLTGYGHVFSMGGTQNQLSDIANQNLKFTDEPFLYRGLLETELPVISAIQGHASGGGFLFGLYADISILALEAVYSAPFMKFGFTPGMGATYILKDKLGGNIATEMMYTARIYTGQELMHHGASLIFRQQKDVLTEAVNIARQLVKNRKVSLITLKQELAGNKLTQLSTSIERESAMHQITFRGEGVLERIDHYFTTENKKNTPEERIVEKPKKMKERVILEDIISIQETDSTKSLEEIQQKVIEIVMNVLKLTREDVKKELTFQEMGSDSITTVEIARDLNHEFGLALEAVEIYEHPTIVKISEFISNNLNNRRGEHTKQRDKKEDNQEMDFDDVRYLAMLQEMKDKKLALEEVAKYLEDNI